MTGSGPLGRDSMKFAEKMKRYHGEIDRLVYAAETICPVPNRDPAIVNGEEITTDSRCGGCPFKDYFEDLVGEKLDFFECRLHYIRAWLGDHVIQHDAMPAVPKCQSGGNCGCGKVRE